MANIYLTGMTASQTSSKLNSKNLTFAGAIYRVLVEAGNTVTWEEPDLNKTKNFYDQFDVVLVGVSPITSLSANRVYGGLNIIGQLWDSNKLKLFIDAPGMAQMGSSLRSVANNPTTLLKEFYSYRKGYSEVVSNVSISSQIYEAINNLTTKKWPTTIYPSLPWHSDKKELSRLISNAAGSCHPISLDSYLISPNTVLTEKNQKWVVDSTTSNDTKKLLLTLSHPVAPMKWNKGYTDDQVYEQIERASGCILSSIKGETTWWSYRYIQSLNAGTPVYSSWQETSKIGKSWSNLAPAIEDMDQTERLELAVNQKIEYINNIPNKKQALDGLKAVLNIK